MEPISNVDRIAMLLRQRLLEQSKASGAASPTSELNARSSSGKARVNPLAGVEGLDDHQMRRVMIQSILSAELGSGLINEARFQQVVDRVTEALEDDEGARALLNKVMTDLGAAAR